MLTDTIRKRRAVTVTLTPDEISELIIRYLKEEGYEVTNVEFEAGTETRGYGLGEHDVTVFTGCSVACNFVTERREMNTKTKEKT